MAKAGRRHLGYTPPVRVVVLMPREMSDYLDKKAKDSGAGNRSGLIRYMVAQMMNDEGLPFMPGRSEHEA